MRILNEKRCKSGYKAIQLIFALRVAYDFFFKSGYKAIQLIFAPLFLKSGYMDKSYRNRFRLKNFDQLFKLNSFTNIVRCSKCTRYNNINPLTNIQSCIFCGNPLKVN